MQVKLETKASFILMIRILVRLLCWLNQFRSGSSLGDLSLVCRDDDPHFSQGHPSVSHIYSSRRPVVNRIVRWVNNVSQGKEDTRQTVIKAEFIEGGTIGRAKS